MPFNTPDDECHLGADDDDGPVRQDPAAWTYSDGPVPGVVIYGHGYAVRVRLPGVVADLIEPLGRISWRREGHPHWRMMAGGRQVLRGSAWLTHRAPGSRRRGKAHPRSPLVALNEQHKMKLYSVGIDIREGAVFVEVQGVRQTDIRRLLGEVLGLANEWAVEHYTTAERYVVLSPADAARLARALGYPSTEGKGAFARKNYTIKAHEIPVSVRRRTPSKALLSCYRITHGATSVFKLEVRLRGRRRDRRQFTGDDVRKLDDILLDLVQRYGLNPVLKPARWEPRMFNSRVESAGFDDSIKPLPQKAWRGRAMEAREVRRLRERHIPSPVGSVEDAGESASTPPSAPTLRSPLQAQGQWRPVTSSDNPMGVRWFLPGGLESDGPQEGLLPPASPEEALGRAVGGQKGVLIEVVLPEDRDPTAFIDQIIRHRPGRKVGVIVIGTQSWGQVELRLLRDHRLDENAEDIIIIVDTTAMSFFTTSLEATVNEHPDLGQAETTAMAANTWDLLKTLRTTVEQTDAIVTVFSVDHRPDSGKGKLRPSNFWTDARVRSFLGDAGRYWCHMRLRVEHEMHEARRRLSWTTTKVVALKDETEGIVGRLHPWRATSS